MTTHNEHRDQIDEAEAIIDTHVYGVHGEDGNTWAEGQAEAAQALHDAGWRKQGSAHPDAVEQAARIIATTDRFPTFPATWDDLTQTQRQDCLAQARALAEAGLLAGQGATHPDVIEKAARAIAATAPDYDGPSWDEMDAEQRDAMRVFARAAAGVLAGQGAADDDTTRLRAELASEDSDRIARGAALTEERLREHIQRLEAVRDELAVQRDERQARIDATLACIPDYVPASPGNARAVLDAIRATLTQVSQPQPAPEFQPGDKLHHKVFDLTGTFIEYEQRGQTWRGVVVDCPDAPGDGTRCVWLADNVEQVSRPQPEPEHADDCPGCDGPDQVPCAADEVRGDVAYRNGEPIKRLKPEWDTYERVAHEVSRPQGPQQ